MRTILILRPVVTPPPPPLSPQLLRTISFINFTKNGRFLMCREDEESKLPLKLLKQLKTFSQSAEWLIWRTLLQSVFVLFFGLFFLGGGVFFFFRSYCDAQGKALSVRTRSQRGLGKFLPADLSRGSGFQSTIASRPMAWSRVPVHNP